MTQAHPTSAAEPDAACPVSLELLGSVYRADEYDLPELLETIPPLKRAQLAAYLYGKSHMHQLGLKVARECTREDLVRAAGEIGSVIHGQAHLKPSQTEPESAPDAARGAARGAPKAPPKKISLGGGQKKISLGGSAAKGRFD